MSEHNKSLPAFPLSADAEERIRSGYGFNETGLSKLEYFAARAPKEIPEWFQHKKRNVPQEVANYGVMKLWASRMIKQEDPFLFASKMTEEVQKINQLYDEYVQQDKIDRAVQWPWFWAQALLDQQEQMKKETK